MFKDLLFSYVLPLLAWGALSGVLNLIFTRKSQIEAWVNANPRLAAWSKFLRSVGFDPWAAHAWLLLLVKKKLPEAQQADSPIAKLEQRKADAKRLGDEPVSIIPPVPPLGLFLLLAWGSLLSTQSSCSPAATAKQLKDPCSELSLATVQAGCEVRIERECNGDPSCPAYVECSRAVETWRACQ